MKAFELSLAVSGERAAVAWHGGQSGPDAIFVQAVDATGKLAGSPHQVSDGKRYAYEPDLQAIDGDLLAAWYEKDIGSGELKAWLARVDSAGRTHWKRQLNGAGGNARNPVVRVAGGQVWAAWIETPVSGLPAIWVDRLSAKGAPLNAPRLAGEAGANTWNLNAAIDAAGAFYVAYDANLGTQANELRLLVVTPDDLKEIALTSDDASDSTYPDIGISDDGQAAITWFDNRDGNDEIYLAVLTLKSLASGVTLPAQRLTHTMAPSIGAYLAWNGQRLAVVWCDAEPGQQDLYAQTFSSTGKAITDVQRLTETPTQSSIPSIRSWKHGFLIGWNEYEAAGAGAHKHIVSSEAKLQPLP